MKRSITTAIALFASACVVDSDAARKTLDEAGYTDIQIDGYSPLSCGEEDYSATAFCARNVNGKVACGVVCCGLVMKQCTIRHRH